MISQKVANQIGDKAQVIVCLIETDQKAKAIRAVQELVKFMNQHVEIEEQDSHSK